ncbi:MAG: hypothetical protein HOW73_22060 [Polyangiaceae bacterium]|nr:hypothetical protein [Polyangiaceae bacterium]
MTPFELVRLVHVLCAVLGLGLIAAVGLVARSERSAASPPSELLSLSRWSTAALGVMMGTGMLLNVLSGGTYHHAWWFRLSAISLVATGAVVGFTRRRARRWIAGEVDASAARRYVVSMSWAACGLVAWITALMELRPFQ